MAPQADLPAFLEANRTRALQLIRKYNIPPDDVQDFLQDLLVTTIEHWPTIIEPRHWFYARLRCSCLQHHRTRRTHQHAYINYTFEQLSTPQTHETRDLELSFDQIVARIPQNCRQPLALRFRAGYTAGQIAQALNLPVEKLYLLLERCRRAFHRALADD